MQTYTRNGKTYYAVEELARRSNRSESGVIRTAQKLKVNITKFKLQGRRNATCFIEGDEAAVLVVGTLVVKGKFFDKGLDPVKDESSGVTTLRFSKNDLTAATEDAQRFTKFVEDACKQAGIHGSISIQMPIPQTYTTKW